MTQVILRGRREEVRKRALLLVAMLAGKAPDRFGIARGFGLAMGFSLLSDVKSDFTVMARGGTGEAGNRWPDLSPKTKAYSRRFGKGEQAALKKTAGLGRGANRRGLLTAAQDKRWRQIFARNFARLSASTGEGEAKGIAAKIAWSTLKKEGAKTKLDVFGNRTLEILRDTGVLFNSLSPGQLSGVGPTATYDTPENQIFKTGNGEMIVGTNVRYAATHQNGDPSRNIPARPFLPKDIPQAWWDRSLALSVKAVEAGAALLMGR